MARGNAAGYFSNDYSSVARNGRDYLFYLTRCCRQHIPFAIPAAPIFSFQKSVGAQLELIIAIVSSYCQQQSSGLQDIRV